MKKTKQILAALLILLCISGCTPRDNNTQGASVETPQESTSESTSEASQSQSESEAAEPEDTDTEDRLMVAVINISKSIEAFDMKEKETSHGWTLTEIEPYDTPPEATFYGFLTFTGEVELSGTITHVNAIYDGYEFVPDEAGKSQILIPHGNPETDFRLSISNDNDPAIAEVLSALAVEESGAYTVTVTQYRLAYVPMMATNNAFISSIEKIEQ